MLPTETPKSHLCLYNFLVARIAFKLIARISKGRRSLRLSKLPFRVPISQLNNRVVQQIINWKQNSRHSCFVWLQILWKPKKVLIECCLFSIHTICMHIHLNQISMQQQQLALFDTRHQISIQCSNQTFSIRLFFLSLQFNATSILLFTIHIVHHFPPQKKVDWHVA